MTPTQTNLPDPPSQLSIAVWAGQIRTIIAVAGGIGIGGAVVQHITDQQITNTVAAFMTMYGLISWTVAGIWSRYSKWQAARKDHATSVAAALATANSPVPVIVVPAPNNLDPNATMTQRISQSDISASRAIIAAPTKP